MCGCLTRPATWAALATLVIAGGSAGAQSARTTERFKPITIADQGSFMVGGTVVRSADGNTFHGDHAYVQYQVPAGARDLPLVMWHGGGQFSKTWETTPDGREGYQTIFLRRGFPVYLLDQPRRGRAGRTTVGLTIPNATPNESGIWGTFRLGVWPNFFPNLQFSRDPAALAQYYRQQTPNTGPSGIPERGIIVDAAAALFDKIGPAVLLTHSASGRLGWLTALKSPNVRAIICYETGSYVFPEGEIPPTPAPHEAIPVPLSEFKKLTRIPIQLVFGDNIPTEPHPVGGLDQWRTALVQAQRFVEAINRHGGDASLLSLPSIGIHGNTHFPFSDLNSDQIADLLSEYLKDKRLDRRTGK